MDLLTVGLAFLEGIALILSPCILPVLPIVLTGSLAGGKRRPIGIIIGFIITFSIVTLFSRFLVQAAHINPDLLRNISYTLLIIFGLVMLSSTLTDKFALATGRLSQVGTKVGTNGGFFSGVLFGALIGLIWTPCAGPILAAVIVQVATLQTTTSSIATVLAFAIGASVPMFIIAIAGRSIMNKFNFIRAHTVFIRKLLGVILIVAVVGLLFFEGNLFSYTGRSTVVTEATKLENGIMLPYQAPAIDGIDHWLNSPPLTMDALKGKVVLIDFWTYSCINCLRTLPYLKDWYAKYHDKGFEIIGVHAPEFEFEKDFDNVKSAVARLGILYPVAMDNHFVTWRNYNNSYWPAHYLIDKNGEVVYEHFGEGEYDVTENNIRFLLGIKGTEVTAAPKEVTAYSQTPEIYLGFARAAEFAGNEAVVNNKSHIYDYPVALADNSWTLKGLWIVYADKIVSGATGASIKLHFNAGKVYAVMGAPHGRVHVDLRLNGEKLIAEKGVDVINGQVTVERNQLYSLVQLNRFGNGIIELTADAPGLEIYTFTFGN